jgi:hypothetical protein
LYYAVERDTSPEGSFPFLVGSYGTTLFNDMRVTANTTYYYRQRVSSPDGWTTLPSSTVQVLTPAS